MSQTRLFVGNLPDNTSEDVLRKAFSPYGEVSSLDIKSKHGGNDEKKFAFVTLSGTNYDIESCIKHFSTEIFNGNQLYVTRARESFLERLQRERQQAQEKEATKNDFNEFVPKTKPVLKLSEKLNPRKRINDDKVIIDRDIPIKNFKSFDTNTEQSTLGATYSNINEKDKKQQDSDKKRMESMKKKRQEFKQKQMIIKTGLVGIDKVKNKKIVFSDGEEDREVNQIFPVNNDKNMNKKNTLFDEEDDSADELNFEIKMQYEGKQGQKVLDLQSRYKSDKRFVLDERFVDEQNLDEGTNQNEGEAAEDQDEEIAVSQTDEKLKQLNILQDVLGVAIKSHITQPIEAKDNKKKAKLGMLRFDPSQPEHAKFLAPKEDMNQESLKKSKKKKKDKLLEEPVQQVQEQNKVEVSKEQFYKVTDALKEAIAQPTTFSLRSLFGTSEPEEKDPKEWSSNYVAIEASKGKKVKNPLDPGEKNPFVYDSSDSEDEVEAKETKSEEPVVPAIETKSVWKENLFFSDVDNRLQDGLHFFSKPLQSEGPKERRELKSVMKKRIYNKERKNQMFQKKIGGRKKTMKKTYRKKS